MIFSTKYEEIIEKIDLVDPIKYAATRNFLNGAITHLSPYISRGVISTRQILEALQAKGYSFQSIEKFVQELAWRDYWQQVWVFHQSGINEDLKNHQAHACKIGLPEAIFNHQTGIDAIDSGIKDLYQTGYLHNHLRMYIASLACNIAQCHWKIPAQWMYYHLLDADWASNALSWQWICGANSHKLYYANQENINKYTHTNQKNTYLDIAYEEFPTLGIPAELNNVSLPELTTPLPFTPIPHLEPHLPTTVYNFYNIDPNWRSDIQGNRILLLEPSVFKNYPVSKKILDFCVALAQDNIPNIKIWVAEFSDLQQKASGSIYYKEHPLNRYKGIEDSRTWMTAVKGNFPSFFAYWKKCKKELF
jgi:deoxyribodipyrimidine photo-lyase